MDGWMCGLHVQAVRWKCPEGRMRAAAFQRQYVPLRMHLRNSALASGGEEGCLRKRRMMA
eukprot:351253-Chlamydomonas_euryale.AAC.2